MSTHKGVGQTARSIADVAGRREVILDAMMQRMVAEIPLYAALDAPTLESVRAITAAYVDGCLQAAREGRGPTAGELRRMADSARQRARQGWPLNALLQGYRVAVGAWWDVVREEAGQHPQDLTALVELAAGLLQFSDAAQSTVVQSWTDEAEHLAADEDRRHHRLMQALMSRSRGDVQALAELAGVELAPEYVVVLAADPGNPRAHPRTAKELRALEQVPHVLAAPRQQDVLVLWPRGPQVRAAVEQALPRLTRGERLAVALADPAQHDGYAGAVEEAAHVLAISGRQRCGVQTLDDVPLQALVRQAGGRTTRVVGGLLDPLREEDELRSTDLVLTLQAYLDADGSTRQAATRLHVHPNTVTYRLDRVRALTGHDPRRLRDALLLVAALELHAGR